MNRRPTIVCLFLLLAALAALGPLNRRLVDARATYGITQADPLINAPPLVVFTTVALGGFRGIVADLLWMRSARLQQEGQYFELVQLADWITALEPRFTEVWAYHAWNLAYNISVLFPDPADRWRWVRHGFTMLRDDGIRLNPGEPRLLYELGWIFQHKIGGDTDDAHQYYKQAWAAEIQAVLGGGRPDFDALRADPVRLQTLLRDYQLDPARMQRIEDAHGPLDWRLPQAHALYWATASREIARGSEAVFADRMIYQTLADAFRRGRLFFGADGDRFLTVPHLDLFPYVLRAYQTAMEHPDERGTALTGYRNFLREAVVLFYLYDRQNDARLAYEQLLAADPEIPRDLPLLEFIADAYTRRGDVTTFTTETAYAAVESALYQAILWEQLGDPDRASGFNQLARLVWNRFMEPRRDRPDFAERTGLPPLEEIRAAATRRAAETIASGR